MELKNFFSSGIKLTEILTVKDMHKIKGGFISMDPGCGCTQMCKKKACKTNATTEAQQ
jgi:hypothetical protein